MTEQQQLRQTIAADREELGRTLHALAAKTDVKARARHSAATTVQAARGTAIAAAADVRDGVSAAVRQARATAADLGDRVARKASSARRRIVAAAPQSVRDGIEAGTATVGGAVRRHLPETVLAASGGVVLLSVRTVRRRAPAGARCDE